MKKLMFMLVALAIALNASLLCQTTRASDTTDDDTVTSSEDDPNLVEDVAE